MFKKSFDNYFAIEAKKQEGITFLLIDMESPGVRVAPIFFWKGTRRTLAS